MTAATLTRLEGGSRQVVAAGRDARQAKRWRVEYARGLRRRIDATPARRHVEALIGAGFTVRGIAEAAGASPSTIGRLRHPGKLTIHPHVAARVLAVTPDDVRRRAAAAAFVPAVGARRRIQALLVLGHRHADLTARLGFSSALVLSHAGQLVSHRTHARVVALYEELWDTPGPSPATAARARCRGYAPPMAWDDDALDDPTATPDLGAPARGIDLGEADWLTAQGLDPAAVAARLGIAPQSLATARRRAARAHTPPETP